MFFLLNSFLARCYGEFSFLTKQDHAKAVAENLEKAFQDKIKEGQKQYPEFEWNKVNTIIQNLLHGKTNQLIFEQVE